MMTAGNEMTVGGLMISLEERGPSSFYHSVAVEPHARYTGNKGISPII